MAPHTTDDGFEREEDTPVSARSADPAVTSDVVEEPQELSAEPDAPDADLAEADFVEFDELLVATDATAHRKRPAVPLRAELNPTTGAIPVERIEAPAAHDVYDYDTDHHGFAPVPAHEERPSRRRRDERDDRHLDERGRRGRRHQSEERDRHEDHDDGPYEPRRTRRRERRRARAGWIAATFIFFLLFGSAATLDWYLWNTTQQWQEHAGKLTEVNYDLGAQLANEQQTTMQLNSEIDLLTQQLATSNQTVTELSAEKAGAVDQSTIRQQEIEALEESLTSAGSVANSLHRCIDELHLLTEYLRDAENYEPEDLENFTATVNELCSSAEQANERLQEALNQ